MSGMTRIGATPLCCSAKASDVASANDARVQSEGWPGVPCISSMTGSLGRLRPNHAGGTQMYACRGVNRRFLPGMVTARVAP